MQCHAADLCLALWRYGRNAGRQIKTNIRERFMSATPIGCRQIRRDLRRRRGRRGLCRHVHAAPAARAGDDGAGVRAGRGRRRHLVLEPLSRRALRCREHAIFLFVLRRTAAGMGLERALRAAARDFEIRQPRRRSLRSASRHPVRHPRRARRSSTRRPHRWSVTTSDGKTVTAKFVVLATGCLSNARMPEIKGLDRLRGQGLPHRPLAA